MSYDLTGLPDYVKDNAQNIVTECIKGLDLDSMTVQPGIKSTENINKLVTDATLQAGGCGWSPSGTTTLSQRPLAVTAYKVQEELCSEDFARTFGQILMGAGAGQENNPFEQIYVDYKVKTVQNALSSKIWNEQTGTGDFSGYLELVTNDVPAGNKISRTSSVLDDVDALIPLMGGCIASGTYIHMSVANYMALMNEIRDKNWFHIASGNAEDLKFMYPGTNIMVVGQEGMGSSNVIMISNKANLFVGTDLQSDFDTVKYAFKEWDDTHRFNMKLRIGVNFAIPEEVFAAV